jgi:hypothetical protein
VRSIQKFFTHRPVSTLDRVPFQLTGELLLYGTTLSLDPARDHDAAARVVLALAPFRALAARARRALALDDDPRGVTALEATLARVALVLPALYPRVVVPTALAILGGVAASSPRVGGNGGDRTGGADADAAARAAAAAARERVSASAARAFLERVARVAERANAALAWCAHYFSHYYSRVFHPPCRSGSTFDRETVPFN